MSGMALILILVNGWQLVSGDKEKGLASGFGGKLGAGLKALLVPWWLVDVAEGGANSHGTEGEDSCLLQYQLWASSGPHMSHLFARGWQDDPSLALHGSSGFLHCAVHSRGVLHQPLPVPQRWVTHFSCHSRYSAFPQRPPIPVSAGLSFLQTGRGTTTGSPGHCATLHSDVETQPPNLESSSVSKNRHELKIPSQNETSPSLWFKVSCIKTNLQTAAFAHKRFCFQEEGLFFRGLNTKPAHLSCHRVGRRSAWQLRS